MKGLKGMSQVLSKMIPVIILLATGYIMKRRRFIDEHMMMGVKNITMNMALPCVLFIAFSTIKMQPEYIWLTIFVMAYLFTLQGLGRLLNRIPAISNPVLPYVVSATAFGLMGIPIYQLVFGVEHVGEMSIIGVGHEFYVWGIYLALQKQDFTGEKLSLAGIRDMAESRLIQSIFLGVLVNVFGFTHNFTDVPFWAGIYQTILYIANLGTPLILFIVGYGLVLDHKFLKMTIIYTVIRKILMISVGYVFFFVIYPMFFETTKYLNYAFLSFFILPPPFALSVFTDANGAQPEVGHLGNNVVVMDTMVFIGLYVLFVFFIS